MGNIFRFFLFSIFLQPIFLHAQKHFDERWKKIDSLMKGKGLTRTASVEVERVYQIAKKEKNETQAIKALIYKIYLNETLEENSIQVNAEALKEEIRIAGEPSASILKSLLAGIYWGYFQDHRWNLYNRTALSQNNQHDPATWSIADFNKNISALFLESVKKEQLLIQTTLASLSPIITRGNAHYLRPTLFDLLAHRALNYFKAGEFNLVRPSYNFELSDPGALSPAAKFIIWQFKTQDSTSLQAKAILIFQDLIKLHMLDAKPEALIDVDIERITFVHDNGTMPNKEHLYMDALKSITERYPENPIAAKSWYFQAIYFSELAESYKSRRDTTNRYANLQAKEICERVIRQKDSSEGKSACESLLNKILRHELHLQAEKVNSPGRPFRISVTYKSLNKVYLRLIKSDPGQTAFYLQESRDEAWWKKLVQMPAFRNLEQPLPDPRDYQTHRTEIKMDALEPGEYILIGTDQLDFSLGEHPLVMQIFYVSAISYINSGEDYFVLHRETGQPLEGISVQVWNQHYDNTSGKWLEVKGEKYFTDPHGHFKLAKPEKNLGLRRKLELSGKGDGLFLRDDASSISYIRFPEIAESDKGAYEKNNRQTFFFIDRSIYRPGQSIFFKGIALTRDFESGKPRILAKFNTTIFLNDVNNQKIDSLVLTTNEFGSYHGKFILPSGKLTGTFSIEDGITGSGQPFSVEEYKRPRFLVRFEKPKAEWRINDKLKIPGNAKAYAGNAIDGATVKYSISRRYGLPSPLGDNQWPKPISGYEIISQGETKTRTDGSFEIEFTAKPEPFVSKEMNPIFDFEVSAEVTDNSGETRSGQTQLRLGYQSLFLNIEAGPLVMDSVGILNEIQIRTTNSMRLFESAKIQLSIFRIETPNRLIRPRYWEASDQFVLTEKEYVNYFPHDEYKNESQPENWPVESMIFSTTDTTKAEKGISLRAQRFSPGWYLFEASTKDKYGEEIKQKQYIEIEDILSRSSSFPAYIGYTDQLQILQPGDTARIGFASSADSVFVVRQINRLKPAYSFSSLNHGYETMKVPIEETDRGGLELSIAFVKDNRIYMASQKIDVPWINKELKITYSSYREKILPGAGDKWKIKIEGFKKDWVASEILSSMYDASLDQFRPHVWYIPGIYPSHDLTRSWEGYLNFSLSWDQEWNTISSPSRSFGLNYDHLLYLGNTEWRSFSRFGPPRISMASVMRDSGEAVGVKIEKGYSNMKQTTLANSSPSSNNQPIQIRKNFNETAFFFPDLRTDDSGNVEFSFTMPEALTQWKWMSLAHTKDLAFGYKEATIITQKKLMVQPNPPRFLRSGDHIEFPVKIVNMTDSELTGQALLQLIDPTTNQPVDGWFSNRQPNQYFTAGPMQSTTVYFPIDVPYEYNKVLDYRVEARSGTASDNQVAGQISDGEEAMLPVLSNRMLVTETLPLNMPTGGTRDFKFEKLIKTAESESLSPYALTVEYTSNPAWYAVQSLPWLMEFPYECAEQVFNRFYANALGTYIIKASPAIRNVFEQWKKDSAGLMSNLQKNQELKSVLMQETPWVLDSKNEEEQHRNLAMLMDMVRMHDETKSTFSKLEAMQSGGGGFPWFKEGPDDRYITQYILTGIGHLKKLGAIPQEMAIKINQLVQAAMAWVDKKVLQDYEAALKKKNKTNEEPPLTAIHIQWLYMRSFFPEFPAPAANAKAYAFYSSNAGKQWLQQSRFLQGMISIFLYRKGDQIIAKQILASLKENAIYNEEMGMYWKDIQSGYYWHQSPLETVSLLIEAFGEIDKDSKSVNALKTWLLTQKQTQNWGTTRATADACYALLLQGADWLKNSPSLRIKLGNMEIPSKTDKTSPGLGYFKESILPPFIKPEMGNIKVTVSPPPGEKKLSPSWGAVYWQYFEDMDKLSASEKKGNPLKLSKKIFLKKNSDQGPILQPIAENGYLKTGDRVTVRIELKSDRDMEYVHMKDMRASCMEPVNVLSGYKWQGALGYYEATQDASTNFFFNWLPKGTHVFEYDLYVSAAGTFTNGITTIQCMYAPEFGAHSEGLKINVRQPD